jgi:hypothetical protein
MDSWRAGLEDEEIMKKIKVLGTDAVIIGSKLNKLHELGVPERERQFRVICGCTGLADANRQCEAAGLDNRTFQRGFSAETGNSKELEIAGDGGLYIVLPDGRFISATDFTEVKRN